MKSVFFAFAFVAISSVAQAEAPVIFKVTVEPKEFQYSISKNPRTFFDDDSVANRLFDVSILNISQEPQQFDYWSCSYGMNWDVSDARVSVGPGICESNYPTRIVLKPGESFKRKMQLTLDQPLGTEIELQLSFRPYMRGDPKTIPKTQEDFGRLRGTGTRMKVSYPANRIKIHVVE